MRAGHSGWLDYTLRQVDGYLGAMAKEANSGDA
jgi:hypothetical protein